NADLLGVHVEGSDDLHIADVVVAEPNVHEAGDPCVVRGVPVVLKALDERARTVAYTYDGHAHGLGGPSTHYEDSLSVSRELSVRRRLSTSGVILASPGMTRGLTPPGAVCLPRGRRLRAMGAAAFL